MKQSRYPLLVRTILIIISFLFPINSFADKGYWNVTYFATGISKASNSTQTATLKWNSSIATTIFNNSGYFVDNTGMNGASLGVGFPVKARSSYGSIRAELDWVPGNANDLPPSKVYVMEMGQILCNSPLDQNIQVDKQGNNGLGDTVWSNRQGYSELYGEHCKIINNPRNSVHLVLPTRTLSASVTSSSGLGTSILYSVYPLKFYLYVAYDKDTASIPLENLPMNLRMTHTDMEAGSSDTTFAVIQSVPAFKNVPIGAILASGGKGVNKNATFTMDGSTTDQTGRIYGTFQASDVEQSAFLDLQDEQNSNNKSEISQVWLNPSYRQQLWSYSSNLSYGQPIPITFRPMGVSNGGSIQLKNHNIGFRVTKAQYMVWDPETENYKVETTTDPDVLAGIASFSTNSPVSDGGTGEYKTNLTISQTSPHLVELDFVAEDEDVYSLW